MDATIQELIAKGFYSEAQDALRAQLAKTQSELGSLDPRVAAMQLQFGDILLMCGSSVEAEKLYEELISKYGNAGENKLFAINAYRSLANMYVDQGKFIAAQQKFDLALELSQSLDRPHARLLTDTVKIEIADLLRAQGKLERAEGCYQSLIESWSAEAQGSTVADLFVRLGNLYAQWKKYELAEDAYHEALERLSPNHLPDDPTVTAALQNLAVLYLRQGEGDKSINLYLKLFDWLDKHQKDTSPAARAHMELALANIYFQQGILTSSEKWYLAALQRMTGALSQQFDFGSAHQDLGELYQKLGRIEEAKKHLRQAIDSKERTFGIRHPGVAAIQATLADLYSRQGNYDKAIELLAIALDTFRTSLGSEHQTVIDLNTRLRTIKASKS